MRRPGGIVMALAAAVLSLAGGALASEAVPSPATPSQTEPPGDAASATPAGADPAAQADDAASGADPLAVVGAPRQRPLSGTILDARTEDVAGLLRCPVCQGLSVADSPATMARNMKGQVRDLLAAGYDQEQVLTYFEASYGEFVRLQPPLRGVNWLVWTLPVMALVAGVVLVTRVLKAQRAASPAPALAAAGGPAAGDHDRLPDDPRLAAHVLRVREQVYGWPGGRAPTPAAAPARVEVAAVPQAKPPS